MLLPETAKCLKVVHWTDDTQLTIGDAMVQCSIDNARLVPIKTCDAMDTLMTELHAQYEKDNQTYFIGGFAFENANGLSYRNWESVPIIDS